MPTPLTFNVFVLQQSVTCNNVSLYTYTCVCVCVTRGVRMSRTWNLFLRYLIALCDAIMNAHPQRCDILLHKKSVWRLWFVDAKRIQNDDRNQVFFFFFLLDEET